ncbi:hypothetical protein GUJ93_ZPchr0004g39464 [Zizania palustris]|uniref:Uncharacterized protein n=1 Tax=Zizania palustris TaxID=103762 RepID=A0A8J5T0Y3_ZIZPA|nr:hypothetical protein GUJ93_ZPchr0004g39464 [Zizania palustris]
MRSTTPCGASSAATTCRRHCINHTSSHVSVRHVLMEKLRESSGDASDVMEAFLYTMFCLLVLMCFGERLNKPTIRAIEKAERAWLIYISRKMNVFFFFRGRLPFLLPLVLLPPQLATVVMAR